MKFLKLLGSRAVLGKIGGAVLKKAGVKDAATREEIVDEAADVVKVAKKIL